VSQKKFLKFLTKSQKEKEKRKEPPSPNLYGCPQPFFREENIKKTSFKIEFIRDESPPPTYQK
jgi:hypothetical protein